MRNFSIFHGKTQTILCLSLFLISFWAPVSSTDLGVNTSIENNASITQMSDGTQLVQETKELVAEYYSVSVSLVSATYIGLTAGGKYKYSYTVSGGSSGWVEWEIIGDDFEGIVV